MMKGLKMANMFTIAEHLEWLARINFAIENDDFELTDWEEKFIDNITDESGRRFKRNPISARMESSLNGIYIKVGGMT